MTYRSIARKELIDFNMVSGSMADLLIYNYNGRLYLLEDAGDSFRFYRDIYEYRKEKHEPLFKGDMSGL